MASKGNDRCKSFVDWKNKSKVELKKKIKSNLERRSTKLAEIVNKTIKGGFVANNHQLYSTVHLLSASLNDIFTKVDDWSGVNVVAMTNAPETFDDYHKRSDNWWNRCKAEWLGDYYFYPFLHEELHQFIANITNHCNERSITELLYFTILSNIINAEIHYHRSRPQPLILDKSFIKSKDLNHLFHGFGVRTCIPWQIPPKDGKNNSNYRIVVRQFAKQWAHSLLQEKQSRYNKYMAVFKKTVATRNTHSVINKSQENKPVANSNPDVVQPQSVPPANDPTSNAFFSGHRIQSTNTKAYNNRLRRVQSVPLPAPIHESYPLQSHMHQSNYNQSNYRIPKRSHPYKPEQLQHVHEKPLLSAQCQIRVYDTGCGCSCFCNGHNTNHQCHHNNEYNPIHRNNRMCRPSSNYMGIHHPSANYILDHGLFTSNNVVYDDELFSVCHDTTADNDAFLTI